MFRLFQCSRRTISIVTGAAGVGIISWNQNSWARVASYCDGSGDSSATGSTSLDKAPNDSVSQIIIPEYDESDALWEEEKMKCSFCKQFILSPCKQPFKLWSKCVDLAKEKDLEFIEVCKSYTRALMDCTEENSEFFAAYKEQMEKERGEETDDIEETDGENSEETNEDKADVKQEEEGVVEDAKGEE